jgi:death-on-curing protein
VEEVERIHADQIARYGGSPGLRSRELLESAVAAPRAGFGGRYACADEFEMAAAYLFHLVKNHAFVDGNKRVGTAAALVFLDLCGVEIECDDDELVELVISTAAGQADKPRLAEFLRASGRRP